MPRSGSRVRIPSPAPNILAKTAQSRCSRDDVPASISLNEPRTVPTCPIDLGKRRAKRSRKVPHRPPDPEKRNPAAAATARGANRKSKTSQKKTTAHRRRRQGPDRDLALYDGRVRLASIMGRSGRFLVVLCSGVLLGTFDTLKQARAEVSAAQHGGAQ